MQQRLDFDSFSNNSRLDTSKAASPDLDKDTELAIFGASLGNHRITHNAVESARIYAKLAGLDLNFMLTGDLKSGGPSRWNYLALGYSHKGALRYAKSLTRKMLDEMKVASSELINWESIYQDPHYTTEKQYLSELLAHNTEFSEDVYSATKEYLSRKTRNGQEPNEEMIIIGAEYLLEELSLMLAAPNIFDKNRAIYLYYKDWPVYTKLIAGTYDNKIRKNLGMTILDDTWDFEI